MQLLKILVNPVTVITDVRCLFPSALITFFHVFVLFLCLPELLSGTLIRIID